MDLFLVRHGQAKSPSDDPERGLTELGVKQAEATASWSALAGARVAQILHSEKKRARQTAEIFSRHLRPSKGSMPTRGMSSNDNVIPTADLIEAGEEPVMIVGHLPFVSRLASQLVAGDPERVGFAFAEATVVCLRRHRGRWFVRWMVTPEEIGIRG